MIIRISSLIKKKDKLKNLRKLNVPIITFTLHLILIDFLLSIKNNRRGISY